MVSCLSDCAVYPCLIGCLIDCLASDCLGVWLIVRVFAWVLSCLLVWLVAWSRYCLIGWLIGVCSFVV